MDALKEYVVLALAASIITAVFGSVVSDSMKGSVRFISGLVTIILFTAPLIGAVNEFASSLSDVGNTAGIDNGSENSDMTDGIVEEFKSRLEDSAASTAAGICGIENNRVSVEAIIDDTVMTNIIIEKLKVTLEAEVDSEILKKDLENLYKCEVEIVISGT